MDIWIMISGLLVGLIIGSTGMGGGMIMTPLLILVFGVPPAVAVGTDLVFATTTKFFGAWQHWRQKSIDWKLLLHAVTGSIPGTLVGVLFMKWLVTDHQILLNLLLGKILAVLFLCIAIIMVCQLYKKRNSSLIHEHAPEIRRSVLLPIGFIVGFLVACTSVGSGTLFIALLLFIYPLSAASLVGTDLIHGVLITGLAGFAHIYLGTTDWGLVTNLIIGSIPGVVLGSKLTTKLPDRFIRILLIILLILSSFELF